MAAIAQLAGVSAPTVSKVINGRAGVAPTTRERVEELLRRHGYRRPASIEPAPLLEVVFYTLESHLAVEIMRGVERIAGEWSLAVGFTEMRGRRTWVEQLLARRPTGVIGVYHGFAPREQGRIEAGAIPLVALDPTGEPHPSIPSVGATNWSGGLAATRHLLELGHRRIATITGPPGFLCSRARLDGFRAAMDGARAEVDPTLVTSGAFSFDDGLREARALLRMPNRPTAIVAGNDLQALGVYEAAREARIRIPEELSVVGFDDVEHARWAGPGLTTVRQPLADMGAMAAEMVLTLARGQRPSPSRVELATTLVVRSSTAPPV